MEEMFLPTIAMRLRPATARSGNSPAVDAAASNSLPDDGLRARLPTRARSPPNGDSPVNSTANKRHWAWDEHTAARFGFLYPRFCRARQSPGDLWWRHRSGEKEARSNKVLYSDWFGQWRIPRSSSRSAHAALHPGVR
jgi:hypothetical protein